MSSSANHKSCKSFKQLNFNKKTRFYAIKIGHQPGIYPCWDGPGGAKEQITGFKGAVYKSFKTIEEAQVFMDKRAVTSDTVKTERIWQLNEIKRVRNSYADGYITNLDNANTSIAISDPNCDSNCDMVSTDPVGIETAKKLISAVKLETLHPRYWNRHQGSYYIFTDGSFMPSSGHIGYGICLSVGNSGGYLKETVPGPVNCLHRVMPDGTTNNQCEMLSIASVIHIAWMFREYFGKIDTIDKTQGGVRRKFLKTITIISDSSYCIDAITKWTPKWIKNGWITADGKPVKNRELLEKINELWLLVRPYVNIQLQHQNSHLSAPPENSSCIQRLLWEGNFLVDLAAKQKQVYG